MNAVSDKRRKDGRRDKRAFPMQKKIDAVALWLASGNKSLVADHVGVSYDTVADWSKTEWWKELCLEVKAAGKVKVDAKLTGIINLALEKVEDRLVNGDVYIDFKSGEERRKEVSLKDALKATTDLMTRQDALQKSADINKVVEHTTTMKEQLAILANQFAKFNGQAPIEVIEMVSEIEEEDDDALYDEREEGLQEGELEVQFETGGEEEEGSTEQGEGGASESWLGPQR